MANVNWFEINGVSTALESKKEDIINFEDMDWNDLREYAKDMGVDLSINKSKKDIIKALKEVE